MPVVIPRKYIKKTGHVDVWDLGPQVAPRAPTAPEEPDEARLKGAELAAAKVEYDDDCDVYREQLRTWNAQRKAYHGWREQFGGPIRKEMWGVDARHALEIEPDRYMLELPRGVKPGKAQIEAEERAKVEAETLARIQEHDPQFGQGKAA